MDEIERMLVVLQNQKFKSRAEKNQFKETIKDFLAKDFDWPLIAKQSLGAHWEQLSSDQQRIFTATLEVMVQNLCISAARYYNGQTLSLIRETEKEGFAQVYLTCYETGKPQTDSVVYLVQTENGWKAYDILIEGVSLADNYRAQFKSLIEHFSVIKLIQTMTEKAHARK